MPPVVYILIKWMFPVVINSANKQIKQNIHLYTVQNSIAKAKAIPGNI